MPKAFIVNPEEDLHKRNSKTTSGNSMLFFFLLLLFPHIKQFIDFIVLAWGKEAWQIWRVFFIIS